MRLCFLVKVKKIVIKICSILGGVCSFLSVVNFIKALSYLKMEVTYLYTNLEKPHVLEKNIFKCHL